MKLFKSRIYTHSEQKITSEFHIFFCIGFWEQKNERHLVQSFFLFFFISCICLDGVLYISFYSLPVVLNFTIGVEYLFRWDDIFFVFFWLGFEISIFGLGFFLVRFAFALCTLTNDLLGRLLFFRCWWCGGAIIFCALGFGWGLLLLLLFGCLLGVSHLIVGCYWMMMIKNFPPNSTLDDRTFYEWCEKMLKSLNLRVLL